jgi:biotin carboxyl carrier protein
MSEFSISLNGDKMILSFTKNGNVQIGDKEHSYELIPLNHYDYLLKIDNRVYELHNNKINSESFSITVNGRAVELNIRTALQEKAAKLIEKAVVKNSKAEVKAPMPGMVLKIRKSIGDNVNQGESLLILEAMKMENDLKSPVDGIIKNIYVKEGAPVDKGSALFLIEQKIAP